MDPSGTIVSAGGTIQLVGLAIIIIMMVACGISIGTGGARGFAGAMGSIVGLFVALWMVARPNDAAGLMLGWMGGFQPLHLPT